MAAVGSVLRCGLRGALAFPQQQQRAWGSNGGSDQVEWGLRASLAWLWVWESEAASYGRFHPSCPFLLSLPQFVTGKSGAIREAGGAFGKKEAAEEERYFKKLQREQLAQMKKHHEEEINHHKKEIERLQKEIERHKSKIKKFSDDD
ncbi:hypothetical protein JD844_005573 [Phrynosoma platyrhinos]|uniref:ATPase inhibitor, mitochondrial n=1 Tax=Phrynosoma platyrhinos TaxID=52577 RepID=A0ABQ7TP86_PHRPL|nr:hypothetical protein JD844_005573 [Phrynosoma platyrhinos]